MRTLGSIRLLQPKRHGGREVHPREFAETVMATAALDPSAGWINGVVGVHPYQLAYADPRVGEEIWADDVDTWVASPYAPQDRKSTRLNSSHVKISYAVFCLKKKNK